MNPTSRLSTHPGAILCEEYLFPLNIDAKKLAFCLHIPLKLAEDIIAEKEGISLDTALRLSAFFGTTAEFWIGLQKNYEVSLIQGEAAEKIRRSIKRHSRL